MTTPAEPDITVAINLDGPRQISRTRPQEWNTWTDSQRTAWINALKRELMANSIVFSLGPDGWEYISPALLPPAPSTP